MSHRVIDVVDDGDVVVITCDNGISFTISSYEQNTIAKIRQGDYVTWGDHLKVANG